MIETCDTVLTWNPEGPSGGLLSEFEGKFKKDPLMAAAAVFFTLPLMPILVPRHVYNKRATKKFVKEHLPRLECVMFYGKETGKELTDYVAGLRQYGYLFYVSTCGADYPDVLAVLWDPKQMMSKQDLERVGMNVTYLREIGPHAKTFL